jgi:hypothetical protein
MSKEPPVLARENGRAYGNVFDVPRQGHGYSRPTDLAQVAGKKAILSA